jgi:predicted DsbA family dithiol-disulfide isomerase
MSHPIKIDVWSDIACPWCYIGKRNLAAGIDQFKRAASHPPVEVEYHSFELAPDTPIDFEGSELDYLISLKGISREQAQAMVDRVTAIAAGIGLEYHYDLLRHTRTLKAHELLHLARRDGVQLEMAERLFRAYFTEGRHLGQIDELATLAAGVGLDPDVVRASLRAEEFLPDVRADQEQATAYGIRGVPFFVLDGTYGVSGAQPPEAFAAALEQVVEARKMQTAAESRTA